MQTAILSALPPHTGHSLSDRKRAADALYATGHLLLEQDKPAHASGVFRAMALLVPTDERAWLGMGACHEGLGQLTVAIEMYGTGCMLARAPVRAELARARVLRKLGRDEEADVALDRSEEIAEREGDEVLTLLVREERERGGS